MTRPNGPAAPALLGLLWLAAFSLLFTAGSSLGLWPSASDPRLSGADLPAGLAFGLAVGWTLLWRRGRGASTEAGAQG